MGEPREIFPVQLEHQVQADFRPKPIPADAPDEAPEDVKREIEAALDEEAALRDPLAPSGETATPEGSQPEQNSDENFSPFSSDEKNTGSETPPAEITSNEIESILENTTPSSRPTANPAPKANPSASPAPSE